MALAGSLVVSSPVGVGIAQAQVALPDPRGIALTDEEAGDSAVRLIDEEYTDARGRYLHLRWERDRDNEDVRTGPIVVDNRVWVATSVGTAQAIFDQEAGRQAEFPEAFDPRNGPFEFAIRPLGDQVVALSACDDCNTRGGLNLHHRIVTRQGNVVSVVYTYGRESIATQGLATWFAARVADRFLLVAATRAPDAGAAPSEPLSTLIQRAPQELVVTLGEVGEHAELVQQIEMSDGRARSYQVRYERPQTFDTFRSGPATVFNRVLVARDLITARQLFSEQVALNDDFPEARVGVGDPFALDEGPVGDEAQGLAACVGSCNSDEEIFVHKRLVSRVDNVVSVVYLWGLSDPEGTTAWRARYFSALVEGRVRA